MGKVKTERRKKKKKKRQRGEITSVLGLTY